MIQWIFAWGTDVWETLSENYHPVFDTLDILAVATIVYWVLILIRGTRAAQMLIGLAAIALAWFLADQLELATLGFIVDVVLSWIILIIIVIFQADIRRALTRIGRGFLRGGPRQQVQAIEEIVQACLALGQRRVGALIVVERDTSLQDQLELATPLDAELNRDLLLSLFLPYSPLHDGAVVIRENRIAAARCILPLGLGDNVPATLGTRHRAAIGVTDESDALAIVVSEETGRIALVVGGEISEDLDGGRLRQTLLRLTGHIREPQAGEPMAGEPAASRDAARVPQETG